MQRRHPCRPVVALLIVSLVFACASNGQVAPAISNAGAVVKQQVERLAISDKISVILPHTPEEFGTLMSAESDSFTFHDVDTNATVQLKHDDASKVKRGYGGYNWPQRRHVDRTRNTVIGAVVIGGLIALIIAAASVR